MVDFEGFGTSPFAVSEGEVVLDGGGTLSFEELRTIESQTGETFDVPGLTSGGGGLAEGDVFSPDVVTIPGGGGGGSGMLLLLAAAVGLAVAFS